MLLASTGRRSIKFQEKPSKEEACSNLINAGTYIFESDILDHIPDGVVSIEKQVFPNILDKGLFGHRFDGYWVDCGTRENLLKAQSTLLEKQTPSVSTAYTKIGKARILRPVMVQNANIGDSLIGPTFLSNMVSASEMTARSEIACFSGTLRSSMVR